MPSIEILKTELTTDPLGRGYAGMTAAQVVASMNAKDRNQNKESLSGAEVAEAINGSEYTALGDAAKDRVINFTLQRSIDPFGFGQTVFIDIFGGGSQTITNLAAARVESVSRAKEIGWGDAVNEGDIINARA